VSQAVWALRKKKGEVPKTVELGKWQGGDGEWGEIGRLRKEGKRTGADAKLRVEEVLKDSKECIGERR